MSVGNRGQMQPERPALLCEAKGRTQFGVLSRRQARTLGMSDSAIDRKISSGEWQIVLPGVLVLPGAPESWEQSVMAACLRPATGAVASHTTAAALWKLSGFPPGPVEISAPRTVRSRRGMIVHRAIDLMPIDIAHVGPIPVTTVARTLLDVGAVADIDTVEQALDDALHRGLVTLPRMRWTLKRLGRNGRPGAARLRRLLRQRGPGYIPAESALELRLISLLRAAKEPEPVRQFHIREGGRVLGRVDLCYPEAKLVIEVDGYEYHSRKPAWQRDRRLQNALTLRGWRVLRVTEEDMRRRPRQVVEEIRAARRLGPSAL